MIHCPADMQVHHVTRQIEYHGELMSLTEAIVGFPVGGQVLISGSTYQRIYGRLHTIGALHPISAPQGRSALGRSRSRRLSSPPKEAWKGVGPQHSVCSLQFSRSRFCVGCGCFGGSMG